MSEEKKSLINHQTGEVMTGVFFGRSDHVRFPGQKFPSIEKDDIVTYQTIDVVKKTGEGETDYVIKHKVKEISRVNRQQEIDSYRNDVGILNILRKCALAKQDPTDGRFASDQKYVDLTQFPEGKEAAYAAVEKGVNAFDKLPDDMKKKMSMGKFVEAFGAEQVKKYCDDVISKKFPKQEEKKGGNE